MFPAHALARALVRAFPVAVLASALAACATPAADTGWRVTGRIDLAGPVRWDYVTVDPAAHRLYVAQGSQVDVVDTRTDRLEAVLADTPGVHGVAVAGDLGRAFSSNGADDSVGIFETGTWRRVGTVKVGRNPDAIVYEAASHRVVTFNGKSEDLTVIDARTGAVIRASLPVGGKPEFVAMDDHGRAYFNIEDTAEIAVLDVATATLATRYAIAPCADPPGLDRDDAGRLYSVCSNGLMVASDPATGRVLGQAPIGAGPDGVVWFEGRAISANGRDGTLSVVTFTPGTPGARVTTVPTARGARTIAVDRALRKLYLPVADHAPPPPPPPAPAPASGAAPAASAARPSAIAGTFHLLVVTPPAPQ
jgi:DNA-binding beta-propeller fold protein YncE